MKKHITYYLSIFLLFGLLMLVASCDKEGNASPNCETVVNENGPAFIKVINERSETIQVYLGNFIPFGADVRSGRCEIYGVPAKNRTIEISTLDGINIRDVGVDARSGETVTIVVGADFF